MKKYITIILAALCCTACMNDWDTLEVSSDIITCDTIGEPTTTITALRSKYASVISNSTYEAIDKDVIVEGIVTGNDLSGNIYQQIYLQEVAEDGVSNALKPGISVGIKGYGALYAYFPVGQKVRINLKGLYIGGYGKLAKIGQPYINTNGALRMGPMTPSYTHTNIMKVGTPHPEMVQAKDITAADVDPSNIDKITPMLVRIQNCTIEDAGDKFAHYDDYLEANENYSVEHTIHMQGGGRTTLYTSTSATFAADLIPAGKLTIYGILSRYSGNYQLQLRSKEDIIEL